MVEALRRLDFGRLEDLRFRAGEPLLDPPPRTIRTLKFGSGGEVGPTPSLEELADRPAVRQLLRHMDRMRDGCFLRIEVRDASPVFSEVEITEADDGGSRG